MEINSTTKSNNESGMHQQQKSLLSKMEEQLSTQSENKLLNKDQLFEKPQSEVFSDGSNKIWRNLSHMFNKTKTRHRVPTEITKEKNSSLGRLSSYFKNRKLSRSTLTPLTTIGISPSGYQVAFSGKNVEHKKGKIKAIAIKLPEGVTCSEIAVTLELNMLTRPPESSDINGFQESMSMHCTGDTDSQTVFTGFVKIPSETDFIRLVTMPLYLIDSVENVLHPGSELKYNSIIKTSNEKLLYETNSESEDDYVKITLTFDKMFGTTNSSLMPLITSTQFYETGKLEERNTVHPFAGCFPKLTKSYMNPDQLPNNEFSNYASCELDFTDDNTISECDISCTSTGKYTDEDIYDPYTSNSTESTSNKNPHKFDKTFSFSQPSTSHSQFTKRDVQNISTQYSVTYLMSNKEVDVQTSFFKHNSPLSIIEPSDSLSTTLSCELNGNTAERCITGSYLSNDTTAWPSSSTTTTTEYSNTFTTDNSSIRRAPINTAGNMDDRHNQVVELKNHSFEFLINESEAAKFSLNYKHPQKSWSPITTMASKPKQKISKEYPLFFTSCSRTTVDIEGKAEALNYEEIGSTDLNSLHGTPNKIAKSEDNTFKLFKDTWELSNCMVPESVYKNVGTTTHFHTDCKRFYRPRCEELGSVEVYVNKNRFYRAEKKFKKEDDIRKRFYEDNDEYYEKHRGDVKKYFENTNFEGDRCYLPQTKRNYNSLLSGDNAGEYSISKPSLSVGDEPEENAIEKTSLQQPDITFSYITNNDCFFENNLSDSTVHNIPGSYVNVDTLGESHIDNLERISSSLSSDKDLNGQFNAKVEELKACVVKMSEIWTASTSNHNDLEIENAPEVISKNSNKEVANAENDLSEERQRTYETAENDIKKVIEELLNESRNIKKSAILNGVKKEKDPAVILNYIKKPSINYTELCLVMIDEMEKYEEKKIQPIEKSQDNVNEVAKQDVMCVIDSLLDEVLNKSAEDIIPKDPIIQNSQSVKDKEETHERMNDDATIAISNENPTKNFEKEQNSINTCLTYFCNCNSKIPKTSFNFGGISNNDFGLCNFSSKPSTSLKNDLCSVNSQNFEKSKIISSVMLNDLVTKDSLAVNSPEDKSEHFFAEESRVPSDKIESQILVNPNSISCNCTTRMERDEEIDYNQPRSKDNDKFRSDNKQNNQSAETEAQGTNIPKSRKNPVLLNLVDIENNMPSTSAQFKEFRTTDEEEFIQNIDLTEDVCIYSRTLSKDACETQETTSSEEEEALSSNFTSTEKSEPLLNQRDTNCTYIELQQKPAVYNMPRPIKCDTGTGTNQLNQPVCSSKSVNDDNESDADDETENITENFNLPKQTYKSKQELNSPQEIADIERNLKDNDILTITNRMVLIPSKTASEIHPEVTEAEENTEMFDSEIPNANDASGCSS